MTTEQVNKLDREPKKRGRAGELARGISLLLVGGVLGVALYANSDRINQFLKPPVGLDPEVILTSADLENESNDGFSPDVVIDLQYGDIARSRQFDSLVPFERLCALIGCESRGMGQKLKDLGYIHDDEGLYGVRDGGDGKFLILVKKLFLEEGEVSASQEGRLVLVDAKKEESFEVYNLTETGFQMDFLDTAMDVVKLERLLDKGFNPADGVAFFVWMGPPNSPNAAGRVYWVSFHTLPTGSSSATQVIESWGNPAR